MKQIVLIEDNAELMRRWEQSLGFEGDQVKTFCHAIQFFDWLDETSENRCLASRTDLFVVDLQAPGFDAIRNEFATSLRAELPDFSGEVVLTSALFRKIESGIDGVSAKLPKKYMTPSEIFLCLQKLKERAQPSSGISMKQVG